MKQLLLLSNSTNFGEPFLQYPLRTFRSFWARPFQRYFS